MVSASNFQEIHGMGDVFIFSFLFYYDFIVGLNYSLFSFYFYINLFHFL